MHTFYTHKYAHTHTLVTVAKKNKTKCECGKRVPEILLIIGSSSKTGLN